MKLPPRIRLDAPIAPALKKATDVSTVRVAVAPAGGEVIAANTKRLKAMGWTPQQLEKVAVTDSAGSTQEAIATKYASDWATGVKGTVRGDGRAVALGTIEHRDPTGRLTQVTTLQQKGGVDTGLSPHGLVKGKDNHTGGKHPIAYAISDAFFALHLETNGIKAERWLGTVTEDAQHARYFRETEQPRLAHLIELRDDPRALRSVIDGINKEVAVELGRPRQLSAEGLFKYLVTQKAKDLADLFWLRMAHRSTTADNIGLRKTIDVSTMQGEKRMRTASQAHVDLGFANEPREVLSTYTEFLRALMLKGTRPEERGALMKVDAVKVPEGALQHAMTRRTLEHLGLDRELAARVQHDAPQAGEAFSKEVMRVGLMQANDGQPMFDPFAALSAAFKNVARGGTRAELEQALAPLHADGRTAEVAESLRALAKPLVDSALKGTTGPARQRLIEVVGDQARRLNAPYDDLANGSVVKWGGEMGELVGQGKSSEVQAQLLRRVWKNQRQGPTSAHDIALRVRSGELKPDAKGWMTLHSETHGRVTFQERSSGDRDVLRIVMERQGEPTDYKLNIGVGGRAGWTIQQAPSKSTKQHLVWEVPIAANERPSSYQFGFVSEGGTGPWYNSPEAAVLGGTDYQPRLGSELLQAELARFAQHRGLTRDAVGAKAVGGLPVPKRAERSTSKVLAKVKTLEDLVALELPR